MSKRKNADCGICRTGKRRMRKMSETKFRQNILLSLKTRKDDPCSRRVGTKKQRFSGKGTYEKLFQTFRKRNDGQNGSHRRSDHFPCHGVYPHGKPVDVLCACDERGRFFLQCDVHFDRAFRDRRYIAHRASCQSAAGAGSRHGIERVFCVHRLSRARFHVCERSRVRSA